ncbi:MAG: DNA-directed RNA polymerase subunit beta' [Patescibacteria group bacterium]
MKYEDTQSQDLFAAVRIAIASPDEILAWSHGEVTKPETINYRTQKPERDGLFDERIFGPTKDWECYCGKYRKIRYKGVVCDKCGVEVTRSAVRRERLGHIDLAVPVAHVWYIHGIPSILGTLLNMTVSELEKVIYFAGFVIIEVNETIRQQTLEQLELEFKEYKDSSLGKNDASAAEVEAAYKSAKTELNNLGSNQIISESRYHDISLKYGHIVRVGIGAEAILELLKRIDVNAIITQITDDARTATGTAKRKMVKRLKLLIDLREAGISPTWLVQTRIPVIPPDLRPMVQLDGGRFAASDLNDLYRRVLNRNNRLKKLLSQGAPEVIARNEKRMLQEAVDALIDNNARRGKAVASVGSKRKLRSLSDLLRGKQGRFRQNLLGKRVDYSGRSVIVVGPNLKLNECGLPKMMALELFKPFIIGRLISDGYVHNVKNATRLIEQGDSFVWDILEEITSQHYVLLNRAPTLHRLGIQAFKPILIEGKAIQIHPLVCSAFNADFDGDQMAVHIPLSAQAQAEAGSIMVSSHNLLKPSSGEPIVTPSLDMVLGCFYITTIKEGKRGEGKIFSSRDEARMAFYHQVIDINSKIKVKIDDEIIETCIGRIIFNDILPTNLAFKNEVMDKRALRKVVKEVFEKCGTDETAGFVDRVKSLGFKHSTLSGMTFSMSDVQVPANKGEIIKTAENNVELIEKQFNRGLITEQERYQSVVQLWLDVVAEIQKEMLSQFDKNSPIYAMITSGARGSNTQLTQMAGMKGLVVNPSGDIIELPMISNFKEGLSVFEYFNSSHGSRKGRADTALRTSEAGYLTRRLVDVSQDIIITAEDCQTEEGMEISLSYSTDFGVGAKEAIIGRVLAKNAGKIKRNTLITESVYDQLVEAGVESVTIRTLLHCQADFGVCQLCYGENLATGKMVEKGQVIGIMAAQAIGEPGTQLTMRNFHMGGVASAADITSGLPRVEELLECRLPRNAAVLAEVDGKVSITEDKEDKLIKITSDHEKQEEHKLTPEYTVVVENGEAVKPKRILATNPNGVAIRSGIAGNVRFTKTAVFVESGDKVTKEYRVPSVINVLVKHGDKVKMGDRITEGHLDLLSAVDIIGFSAVQKYIIEEVQSIYASQGQSINNKHVEVIVKRMSSKVRVLDSGSTSLLPGQITDRIRLNNENKEAKAKKGALATAEDMILGITRVAILTDSFLSAASFQETTSVLIGAATTGKIDHLRGLKENVIIGKLIPAGTGLDTVVELAVTEENTLIDKAELEPTDMPVVKPVRDEVVKSA